MDKVIVIGCHIGGLAAIRALSGRGLDLIAMTHKKTDVGEVSKYVSERVHTPHPEKEEKKFIDVLVNNADRWKGALLLATEDDMAVAIAKNKDLLANFYKVAGPDWDILHRFIDKQETYVLAEACDIPYPKTFTPNTLEEISEIGENVGYPCILKPMTSHRFVSTFGTKNFEVGDATELSEKFRLCLDAGQRVMVQEVIPGPDTNLYRLQAYVNSQGRIGSKFFNSKVRQNPPQFGVIRVGMSTEKNQVVEELSERIVKHTSYRGIFSIEFKKDPRDNLLKLIEVNARLTRSSWMAVASGINFPWIVYLDLVRNEQIEVDEYTRSLYWIEILPDFYHSIFSHYKEDFTVGEYLKPYLAKHKAFAVFSWSDLRPFFKQVLTQLALFFRRSTKA